MNCIKSKDYTSLAITQDYPPIPGGVSVYIDNIFKNWSKKVIIIAPNAGPNYNDKIHGKIILNRIAMDLNRNNIGAYIKRQIQIFRASWRIIKKEKIDFIHCCHISSGLSALLLKKICSIPYVLYTYGSEITGQPGILRRIIAKMILSHALRITTMSYFTRQAILDYGIAQEKIRFLVGVEVEQMSRQGNKIETREKYNITGDPVILTVARLVPHKGIDTVIQALPAVVKIFPDLVYLIVGDGPYRNELDKLGRKLKVDKHLQFVGNIPHEKLQERTESFYSVCNLFIMVSRDIGRIEAEGFGLVFLEAGLSKKPTIGGNSGGIQDAVLDGVTGIIVDPLDPYAVSRSIISTLENKEISASMGEKGYERAISLFDWKKNIQDWEAELDQYIKIYQNN